MFTLKHLNYANYVASIKQFAWTSGRISVTLFFLIWEHIGACVFRWHMYMIGLRYGVSNYLMNVLEWSHTGKL